MRYQISAGIHPPEECEIAVVKFYKWLTERPICGYNYIISTGIGYDGSKAKSIEIITDEDLSEFIGTIQWICQSPVRPNHKRKNWFITFTRLEDTDVIEFDESLIVFESFRSSGPGGQNVNKVETGIRATYKPLDLIAEATEERSQKANKKITVARLKHMVDSLNQSARNSAKNNAWQDHNNIERGNPVAIFVGEDFKRKKVK